MAWYVWSFLIVLLCSWLILLYKSLVWLGCCACCRRTTTTRKGVTRDSDGNIVACRFCAIAQQPQLEHDAHNQTAPPTAPLSTSPTSPTTPSPLPAHFDTIHDPTALLPSIPLMTSSSPTPALTRVLYSTPWLVVFSPLHPAAVRHLLVIPRKHIDDCNSLVTVAASTAQQKRKGQQQPNGIRVDDDSGEAGYEDDDEQVDELDEEEVSFSLRRRRRWSVEEEKELTPHQYITHMMEVGQLLLHNPQLLADPNGGTRIAQPAHHHNSRLRGWMRRMDCRRGGRRLCRGKRRTSRNGRVERSGERLEAGEEEEEDDREEQMEQERSEKQQLLLDTSKPKTNGYHHHAHTNGVNGRSRDDKEDGHLLSVSLLSPSVARRRTPHSPFPPTTPSNPATSTRSNPATPTPVSRTLSSSSSPSGFPSSSLLLSSSSAAATTQSASHVVGMVDGSGGGGGGGGSMVGGGGERYCFHVPPHNSISHLHMHCMELPFDNWWTEWSFRANTRWCKEADTVKREIEQVNKTIGSVSVADE